ncbi:MAG TPA: response regulator [Candidatus Saccharimonadales bacterium]|nr:response regulator [Candidatus Saccharimonadales bacterium]
MEESKKIVLLVEDDHDICLLYSEVLQEAGYTVSDAGDGNSGLRKAINEPWDILLLDIMLPGQDGLHVLKHIKDQDSLKNKPVILLTNLGSESIISECFSLGASGYLIKSEITPDKIVSEVNSILRK